MLYDVVDFHAHILPEADHGSDSVETSLRQLRYASLNGVSRIVATPHFYPHRHTVSGFLSRRDRSYIRLREHIGDGMPEIRLGAEVLICENIEKLEGLSTICIAGTNTLLLELPFVEFNDNFCTSVENLISNGYDIVLAHADRYPYENIEKLVAVGAKIQLNTSSISTFFKNKALYDWAERGLVIALGSDIHKADKGAYKKFKKAQDKFLCYIENIKNASDEIWERAQSYSQMHSTALK
jgi:protein-tyrosine phosphatase